MGTTGKRSAADIAASAAAAASAEKEEEANTSTSTTPPRARTINDFEDRKSISAALRKLSTRASQCSAHSCPLYDSELSDDSSDDDDDDGTSLDGGKNGDGKDLPNAKEADWITENMFMETSLRQSVADETDRLMALKSYLILDSNREPAFERLTGLAQRFFDVPIALVSLIDIGRQWFMSNRGLGDVRETPRKAAFCAHAIQSTEDLLIVPNTLEDPRFRNNGLVTGAPHIRFYAGAPLICPEGYKLGTLCVIDTKTRPDGLTLTEKQNLKELAALVMEAMVNRRKERMALAADRSKVVRDIPIAFMFILYIVQCAFLSLCPMNIACVLLVPHTLYFRHAPTPTSHLPQSNRWHAWPVISSRRSSRPARRCPIWSNLMPVVVPMPTSDRPCPPSPSWTRSARKPLTTSAPIWPTLPTTGVGRPPPRRQQQPGEGYCPCPASTRRRTTTRATVAA